MGRIIVDREICRQGIILSISGGLSVFEYMVAINDKGGDY
jgi:hypothetical protein